MTAANTLSRFNPKQPIQLPDVPVLVQELKIINGNLVAVLSDSSEVILGKYKGFAPPHLASSEITVAGAVELTLTDGQKFTTKVIRVDQLTDVSYAGTGAYVGVKESGVVNKDQDPASKLYHLVAKPNFSVSGIVESITTDDVKVTTSGASSVGFGGHMALNRLAPGINNGCYWNTTAPTKWIQIELPVIQTIDAFLIANCNPLQAVTEFKLTHSKDGTTWVDLHTDILDPNGVISKIILPTPIETKMVRLTVLTFVGANGSLGRLDIMATTNRPVPSRVPKLHHLIPSNPVVAINNVLRVVTEDGVEVTASSSYNADYRVWPLIQRRHAEGIIYGTGGPGSWVKIKFPKTVKSKAVLLSNYREYRTHAFKLQISNDDINWETIYEDTLQPIASNVIKICEFVTPVTFIYIRCVTVTAVGENPAGLGRFDVLSAEPDYLLSHAPVVFDPLYFTTTENSDKITIGRTNVPIPTSAVSDGIMQYANYSKFNFVIPANNLEFITASLYSGNGIQRSQAIVFNQTVVNNNRIIHKAPRFTLTKGRYHVRITLALGGAVNGYLWIQDLVTKLEVAKGYPFKNTATTTPDQQSIVADFEFSCIGDANHLAVMLNVASIGLLHNKSQVGGSIEFWKVSNQLTAATAVTPLSPGPQQSPNTWVVFGGERYYHLMAPMNSYWANDIQVSADSELASSNPRNAWKAFDRIFGNNDVVNLWTSANHPATPDTPHWLQVSFPVPTQVDAVALYNGQEHHVTEGRFVGSDNGVDWTTLFEFKSLAAPTQWTQRNPWLVSNPGKYLHYRFIITASNMPTNNHVQIGELLLLSKTNYSATGKIKVDTDHLGGALTTGGLGGGLFDGITPINTSVAAQVAAWSAANTHVIFKVHGSFKLWRTGIDPAKSAIGLFKITRLEDQRDFTLEQLPLLDLETGRWQQFTYALPAGTYRFEHFNVNRVDGEWFFEASPTNVIDGRIRNLVSKPMVADNTNNQIVTASSVSADAAQYQPWNLFNYADDAPGYGWVSHNTLYPTLEAPQWVQIEFTDGPKTINGYYINSRGVDAGPGQFELVGKNKADADWTVIHTVAVNKVFGHLQPIVYLNVGEFTFEQFRLVVTGTTVANKPCGFRHWCLVHDSYN